MSRFIKVNPFPQFERMIDRIGICGRLMLLHYSPPNGRWAAPHYVCGYSCIDDNRDPE
ncbi:hypothetical protein ABE073_02865 [Lederbergia citrisecunda]|uniref:hypothetical protein n=1 Tax=Lederbergia citrisecunda TaxID=2833583 RepID=UPI003D2A718A